MKWRLYISPVFFRDKSHQWLISLIDEKLIFSPHVRVVANLHVYMLMEYATLGIPQEDTFLCRTITAVFRSNQSMIDSKEFMYWSDRKIINYLCRGAPIINRYTGISRLCLKHKNCEALLFGAWLFQIRGSWGSGTAPCASANWHKANRHKLTNLVYFV